MSTTPNLELPLMATNTLQPSTPFNEAMQLLDAVNPLIVQDIGLLAPPVTTAADAGKRWIVPTGGTDAWAGHDADVALCTGENLWTFIAPIYGLRAWCINDNGAALNKYYRYNGSGWADDSASGAVTEAPQDGKEYVRKDAGWVELTAGDVSSVNGEIPDTNGNVIVDSDHIQHGTETVGAALDALEAGVGHLQGINDQTGTAYTVASTDAGKDVRCTNAAAVALNIDTAANSGIAIGFWCLFSQGGAGTVTATALSGVTLRTPSGAATTAQYDARGLEYLGADTWRVW